MRIPIKLICRKKKLHPDGTSTVYIQYCFSISNRTLLHTGIKVPPNYWDFKARKIKENLPLAYGHANTLNDELTRLTRITEDLVTFCNRSQIANKGQFVKEKFSPSFCLGKVEQEIMEAAKQADEAEMAKSAVYYQFDDYIKSKERRVSPETLIVYRNVKAHLLSFQIHRNQPITFQSFDFNFCQDFVDYLTFEHKHLRRQKEITGLKLNTIGKTIKQFFFFAILQLLFHNGLIIFGTGFNAIGIYYVPIFYKIRMERQLLSYQFFCIFYGSKQFKWLVIF